MEGVGKYRSGRFLEEKLDASGAEGVTALRRYTWALEDLVAD